jgi:hypothetical protein
MIRDDSHVKLTLSLARPQCNCTCKLCTVQPGSGVQGLSLAKNWLRQTPKRVRCSKSPFGRPHRRDYTYMNHSSISMNAHCCSAGERLMHRRLRVRTPHQWSVSSSKFLHVQFCGRLPVELPTVGVDMHIQEINSGAQLQKSKFTSATVLNKSNERQRQFTPITFTND